MSELWAHAIGVVIVLMMLVFGAIWVWAWLPYHRRAFDALARLPMRDDGLDQTREDDR